MKKSFKLAILAAGLLTLFGGYSYAKNTPDRERNSAITAATQLYPEYMFNMFRHDLDDFDGYVKYASMSIFENAAIWKTEHVYILYRPSNAVGFILPKKSLGKREIYSLSPSHIMSMTGGTPVTEADSFITVAYVKVPQAINSLVDRFENMPARDIDNLLATIKKDELAYKAETLTFLNAPYFRAKGYEKCLSELNGKQINEKIKLDAINAKMPEIAASTFKYLDFVRMSDSEALLILASDYNGSVFAINGVLTDGKCRYTDTQYKNF